MMSCKNSRRQNTTSARKAAERTFTFFLLLLLAHTIYGFYKDFSLNASFYIMIGGLVFFYVNDYLLERAFEGEKNCDSDL